MPTADYSSYRQASGTGADGTKFSNFVDAVQTNMNGIDNNNFAAGKIFDPAKLMQSGASSGQALIWNGTDWDNAYPPGYEIHYKQIIAPVNIASTTEATGTTIITCDATTFDGTAVWVEFFAPAVKCPTNAAGDAAIISLFEGATQITRLGQVVTPAAAATELPFRAAYRFTPTAASHTYTITAKVNTTTGTPLVRAGAAVTGDWPPAFVRFTKA